MADLTWYPAMKIGLEFIDQDHQHLLKIMQETKLAIEQGNDELCVMLLTSLLNEAKAHFEREEEFLSKVGYPGLDQHKIYHQELLVKANTTKRICQGIETEHDLRECFNGMANFLIDDVLRGDLMFKSFLEYEGHIRNDRLKI